jgi:predicted alpha/beta-fold hydrolase
MDGRFREQVSMTESRKASLVKRLLLADQTPKAFLQMLDRPRAELMPAENKQREVNGIEHWHFTYAAEEAQRVTGLLTKATGASGKRPVVIILHSTGGDKEESLDLLQELAQRGFVGVAVDGRYHGERSNGGDGYSAYTDAILHTYRTGKSTRSFTTPCGTSCGFWIISKHAMTWTLNASG